MPDTGNESDQAGTKLSKNPGTIQAQYRHNTSTIQVGRVKSGELKVKSEKDQVKFSNSH